MSWVSKLLIPTLLGTAQFFSEENICFLRKYFGCMLIFCISGCAYNFRSVCIRFRWVVIFMIPLFQELKSKDIIYYCVFIVSSRDVSFSYISMLESNPFKIPNTGNSNIALYQNLAKRCLAPCVALSLFLTDILLLLIVLTSAF